MRDAGSNANFSIITVCYNSASTLSQAIASVQKQLIPQGHKFRLSSRAAQLSFSTTFQHLIIDGGSTDGSLEIARTVPHISQIVSEPDSGIYDAMNKGISLANGNIIGILNADDFYASPDVLAKVADVFEDPEIDACFGDLLYVDNDNTEKIVRYWRSGDFDIRKFYWGWMPPHPTFFVRRAVYERFGLFNLDLGSAADYELMLRFLVKHKIQAAYIPEVLVKMRTGGISNASWRNRVKANKMDRRAWVVNDLTPYPWTLWLKPLRKIGQWIVRRN